MAESPLVSIVMGSDSDLEIMNEAAKALDDFGIAYEIDVIGKPGATNAGILAAQIIGLGNTTVAGKLKEMKGKLVKSVEEKSNKLQQMRKR
jgi:5-(carboxyamino)imidazole ribonucleotide mutase